MSATFIDRAHPLRAARVLLAVDGSSGAERAVTFVAALALRRADDVVNVATVVQRPLLAAPDAVTFGLSTTETSAAEIADDAARELASHGIATHRHILEGPVAHALLEAALDTHSELIVVGSRGRGFVMGAVLGSVARWLAHHSPIPILVVRDRADPPRLALVVADGSADAAAALAAFRSLPLTTRCDVVPLDADTDVATILTAAERTRADLIVLGAEASRAVPFLGDTADRVLSTAHCAVLVARAAERVHAVAPSPQLVTAG